jgi:hypothetical protein
MTQELEVKVQSPPSAAPEEPKPEIKMNKQTDKRPRMLCTVCMNKDSLAVRYYTNRKRKDGQIIRTMDYEHREEPPISQYNYPGRQTVYRYRRCYAGRVMTFDQAIEPTTKTTTGHKDVEILTKQGTILVAKQNEKKQKKSKLKTNSKSKQKISVKSERKHQEELIEQIKANWLKRWKRLTSRQEIEKTKLIDELALELKKNLVPTNSICNKIVKMCKGIISPTWIRKNLGDEYKSEYRVININRRWFSNTSVTKPEEFQVEYLPKYNKKFLCSIIEFLVRTYAPEIGK